MPRITAEELLERRISELKGTEFEKKKEKMSLKTQSLILKKIINLKKISTRAGLKIQSTLWWVWVRHLHPVSSCPTGTLDGS